MNRPYDVSILIPRVGVIHESPVNFSQCVFRTVLCPSKVVYMHQIARFIILITELYKAIVQFFGYSVKSVLNVSIRCAVPLEIKNNTG